MSKASQLITLLGAVSERGEYVAERLREDLAKAWANGEHNVVKRKLDPGEFHTVNEKIAYDTQSKGTTIEKAVNYFAECCGIFQDLSKALDTAPDADEAAKIWDGWDKDLEKYWDFVKDLTTKLKEDGIRRYVGAQFKTIFESTIQAFELAGEKVVIQAGPKLDPTKARERPYKFQYNTPAPQPYYQTEAKLRDWTDRTKIKLQDGLKAAATGK